jgi:hypothetical protein
MSEGDGVAPLKPEDLRPFASLSVLTSTLAAATAGQYADRALQSLEELRVRLVEGCLAFNPRWKPGDPVII